MTMGPGTVGEKVDKAMGRVGNWLGGVLAFSIEMIDWKACPYIVKILVIGAALIWFALAVRAGWLWLQ